jgi:hypothetical protein
MRWISTCLLLTLTCFAESTTAGNTLGEASYFALGPVSIGAFMSPGERDLRDILKRDDATVQLEAILPHASPAGQLYALLGLKLHDPAAYERAVKALRKDDPEIDVRQGCGGEKKSFHSVAADIRNGTYDPYLSRPEW